MALCLVIVAGSVLFGIYGPSIAQRSMLGGGVSIGDLVQAAVAQRDQLLWQALEARRRLMSGEPVSRSSSSDRPPHTAARDGDAAGAVEAVDTDDSDDAIADPPAERTDAGRTDEISRPQTSAAARRTAAAEALRQALGHEVVVPDLSSAGYELAVWSVVSLGGTGNDAIALGYLNPTEESFVALYFLVDDGRFVVFDGFGRAVPLLPDRLSIEEVPLSRDAIAVVMVWSLGPVMAIAVVDSPEAAVALRSPLGAP